MFITKMLSNLTLILFLIKRMECSLSGSSIHGIFQARILAWITISFSRGSSQCRDQTQVSHTASRLYCLSHQGSPYFST